MNAPAPYEPRVPSDTMSPGRAALSVSWAALPFLTFGLATPFVFLGAALWRRTAALAAAALVYLGVFAVQVLVVPGITDKDSQDNVQFACWAVQAVGGCFHAFLVRRRVFDPDGVSGLAGNQAAIARVRHRRMLRERARELARTDPGLAKELRIGRPDLSRHYDDGGLVDVNHAPAGVLRQLPGITDELARRIERVRGDTGGFLSAEELSTLAALPPALTADLAEYGIFLP